MSGMDDNVATLSPVSDDEDFKETDLLLSQEVDNITLPDYNQCVDGDIKLDHELEKGNLGTTLNELNIKLSSLWIDAFNYLKTRSYCDNHIDYLIMFLKKEKSLNSLDPIGIFGTKSVISQIDNIYGKNIDSSIIIQVKEKIGSEIVEYLQKNQIEYFENWIMLIISLQTDSEIAQIKKIIMENIDGEKNSLNPCDFNLGISQI